MLTFLRKINRAMLYLAIFVSWAFVRFLVLWFTFLVDVALYGGVRFRLQ
jgi:hypothetical protein